MAAISVSAALKLFGEFYGDNSWIGVPDLKRTREVANEIMELGVYVDSGLRLCVPAKAKVEEIEMAIYLRTGQKFIMLSNKIDSILTRVPCSCDCRPPGVFQNYEHVCLTEI